MENENNGFELTNKNPENWEKAEFWEYDPMKSEPGICDIVLYVNWETKEVTVETQMDSNGVDGDVWHHLASEYSIAEDTDFERFPKFFKENIQPILQKIGESFESYWDGSNWKGRFGDEYEELTEKIGTLLRGHAPRHYLVYYLSLRDSYEYGGMAQLRDDLESEGIDILTADLSDSEIMEKAVNAVTSNEGFEYKLIDVDVESELRDIQKELIEEDSE